MTKEENEKRLARLKNIVLNMPEKPGSYQYYDESHTIIYVGKAKNLKRRVSSYFHKEVDRYKTKVLVSKIWDISYTVVNSEEDALLLENRKLNEKIEKAQEENFSQSYEELLEAYRQLQLEYNALLAKLNEQIEQEGRDKFPTLAAKNAKRIE